MKKKSVEAKKARNGYLFLLPWTIGLLLFVIIPIFKSIIFSFSKVTISALGVSTKFVWLDNFRQIVKVDPSYMTNLLKSLSTLAYSLPIITVLSLIFALVLNTKFKGRLFFRTLYFAPVVIASGVVLELLFQAVGGNVSEAGVSSDVSAGLIDVAEIMQWVNLPPSFSNYISSGIENIFTLVWSSGIQIVLFIAGMQSIPDSMYEVSRVEGATKWEEFWFITIPMLSRVIILVVVFTIVEILTSKTNAVMDYAYNIMSNQYYDTSSAMIWLYFLIVSAILGLLLLIYNKAFLKRWE